MKTNRRKFISSSFLGSVAAAIPNAGPYHEFKGFNTTIPFECKTSSLLTTDDGLIKVPTGPGLGITIDPGYIKKHEVIRL